MPRNQHSHTYRRNRDISSLGDRATRGPEGGALSPPVTFTERTQVRAGKDADGQAGKFFKSLKRSGMYTFSLKKKINLTEQDKPGRAPRILQGITYRGEEGEKHRGLCKRKQSFL